MRRSEILKLRWCDVDLDNGFASLYDTKNGEDNRRVPLIRRCIEVLRTVLQEHERCSPSLPTAYVSHGIGEGRKQISTIYFFMT